MKRLKIYVTEINEIRWLKTIFISTVRSERPLQAEIVEEKMATWKVYIEELFMEYLGFCPEMNCMTGLTIR